jgi:hypothetical protein
MPRVATEIPETMEAIVRPVALDIIRQVGKLLGLPKSTAIYYPGSAESAAQTGSTLNYEGEPSSFPFYGKLKIEANEQYIEDRVLTDAVYRHEFLPIFIDKDLGVRIHPVYSATEMILSFTYRAESRVAAERFRDDIKMRTSMLRKENLHELTYHYGIPATYLQLCQEIHTLREKIAPYGEDFSKWFMDHVDPRVTNITTLIGTSPTLVIPEHQVCALGWFDFAFAPEPAVKDSESGTFDISFEYRVTYDKVISCVMEYPLVVHNQMIAARWHGQRNASGDLASDPGLRKRAPSLSRYFFDKFVSVYPCECQRQIDGVSMPVFDDWIPDTVHPDTSTVFTAIVQVSPTDRGDVVNLQSLGDWKIDPTLLPFLQGEAPFLTTYGQSVVYLSLYRDGVPVDDGGLTVDAALNVRYTPTMDLRQRYHLRIALVNDLTILDRPAIERFRSGGQAALKILTTLQAKLGKKGYLPVLRGGKYISYADILEIGQRINSLKTPYQTGVEYAMLTVGNFIIAASRSSDYAPDAADNAGGSTHEPGTGAGDGQALPGCGP